MTTSASAEAVVVDRLSVRHGSTVACDSISLRVLKGDVFALLGRAGAGKSSLLACIAGRLKPSSGSARVFGADSRKDRRRLRALVAEIDGRSGRASEEIFSKALDKGARLLLIDQPHTQVESVRLGIQADQIQRAVLAGATTLIATRIPSSAEAFGARSVGLLVAGKLVLQGEIADLRARFRRIRYRNEMTQTRTDYGTELDLFDAVRVRVRGWGTEAIVSNFSSELLERLRRTDGVADVSQEPMTLEDLFEAVSPVRPVSA